MSVYKPVQVETLPASFLTLFNNLENTFTPANDCTVIRTITGHNLQLLTVRRTKNGPETPIIPAGYQKAIWELREGHLRWCPSEKRLYRRDADMKDHPGDRYILNSWHAIKTIEAEYGIDKPQYQMPAYSSTIIREAQRAEHFQQVERGVRIDPLVWVRRDGHVVCLRDEYDLAVTQTFDTTGMSREAIKQADQIMGWLTINEASKKNLIRMFATPWLEPFKQLSYVFSGHGGDGKSLIMSQAVLGALGNDKVFPAFSASQFCQAGSYTLTRESLVDAMDGMAFAYDDEAGEVDEPMLPYLRALSTGTTMQARVIGGKYRNVDPSATIVLLTNQGFADSSENSDRRRFIKVEFHSNKNRSYSEYHAIEEFVKKHPAAVFALSCQLWESGDEPEIVNLSPARQISDEMFWLINEITMNQQDIGQPIASRTDYRKEFHKSIDPSVMQLLGLKNSTSSLLEGKQQRVVRVDDWQRFERYQLSIDEDNVEEPTQAPPAPIEDCTDTPSEYGFVCDYVSADSNKVAQNWKQLAASPNVDTSSKPDSAAYAVVPSEGYVVIDMDVPKDGSGTGWTVLNQQVGSYGTPAFPQTYLVGTPSGGVHAYYKVPASLAGRLKNAAHPQGVPIDLRVDGKGYVIGAGSHVSSGDYRLLDVPADMVPELSLALSKWLVHTPGYVMEDPSNFTLPDASSPSASALLRQRGSQPKGSPRVDMSPIPEGSRNVDLHAWAYGRAMNHPENLKNIELDLYERAHLSGLKDSEIAQMWRSILNQVRHSA